MSHDDVMRDYLRFHAPRFDHVLRTLQPHLQPGRRVLDIGWSDLTRQIHFHFGVQVDALGFDADGPLPSGRYYHFDLNRTQTPAACRHDLPAYDAIVFAEVLEHLHTSPALVLGWLAGLLRPGGVLLVQTPNAVALPRRVKMLFGRNPFELIREDATNPGHFREYTAVELARYAVGAGLAVESVSSHSYFDFRYARHGAVTRADRWLGAVKNALYPWLPGGLRPGLTAVFRRPHSARMAPGRVATLSA
jgi:SAM-dependent methyltransferase